MDFEMTKVCEFFFSPFLTDLHNKKMPHKNGAFNNIIVTF